MADLPAQMTAIRGELRQQRSRDRAQLFQEGLKDRLKSEGKLKIYQDVISRVLAAYQRS